MIQNFEVMSIRADRTGLHESMVQLRTGLHESIAQLSIRSLIHSVRMLNILRLGMGPRIKEKLWNTRGIQTATTMVYED